MFCWLSSELQAPGGLVVLSTGGNLTVCWTTPLDGSPDGYYITSLPQVYHTPTTLWLNQSISSVHLVNQSTCIDLGKFIPGQTYEVRVVSLKGNDRSKATSIIHTTGKPNNLDAQPGLLVFARLIHFIFASAALDPVPIQVAVPLSVGTNFVQLHILRPQLSVIDGVKVCACPGVCTAVCRGSCGYTCDWYPLLAGVHVLTLQNLSPGTEYQLRVHSTSHHQTGPPYYTQRIKTGDCSGLICFRKSLDIWTYDIWIVSSGLAPPNRVREGVVTDSSIELLWDAAQGDADGYEVICLSCEHSHMVNFTNL